MVELLERDQLLNQLEALSADDGRLVFVGGEAGVGKTSLVRAFAAGRPAPSLFGQEFDEIKADNRYGIPASWALHAWIWKPNPSGMLYAWNPRVDCSDG